jgi:hypothetical protein
MFFPVIKRLVLLLFFPLFWILLVTPGSLLLLL